jgi:hypothetical protein
MSTLQRIFGAGPTMFGTHWADAYFQYEYSQADADDDREHELWTVRVEWNDFDALGLRRGEPVRLYLPGHAAASVQLRRTWVQTPFVWLELERAETAALGAL